jgi:hypothetical protein
VGGPQAVVHGERAPGWAAGGGRGVRQRCAVLGPRCVLEPGHRPQARLLGAQGRRGCKG